MIGVKILKTGKRKMQRLLALFCTAVLALSPAISASAEGETTDSDIKTVTSASISETAYFNYYSKHVSDTKPVENIEILPNAVDTEIDGKSAVTLGIGKNAFEANFNIEKAGTYFLKVTYRILEENNTAIQTAVKIDGEFPFDEAERFELSRYYVDDIKDGKFDTDKYDNDIRPSSKEIYRWQTRDYIDSMGLYSEPYMFALTEGEHTLSITSENDMVIASAELYNPKELISYEDYIKQYKDAKPGKTLRQEAEHITEKNSDNIYPTYEKKDASTLPNSPSSIKLNTIGQGNWSGQGQYLTWTPEIEKAGLYSITFRVNQSYNNNGSSYRRLLINGEVPFKEADSIEFHYAINWYMKTLGDDKPLYVYLEPGDTVTLECSADVMCGVSRNINSTLNDLSAVYREIFVITGANPDVYTDYNLDVKIPTLMDELNHIKTSLEDTINLIIEINGSKNSAASTLSEILETIEEMIEKPYDIHRYVTKISDKITSMGSLVITIGQQPLEVDCIYYTAAEEKITNGKASLLDRVGYSLKRFLCSYSTDYGSFSGKNDDVLKVWISTGRDQLTTIQQMIEDDFENTHDVNIELSLVDTGATLLQATIAGKGPDVALNIEAGTPIQLAIRGALVDLTDYELDSIKDRFYPSAWTSFTFEDSIYAIPETQVCDVIFYRTDIFDILGIEPPNTWDEFYSMLELLQRNNFEVGIPEIGPNAGVSAGISTFARFLLQKGGTYYTEDYRKTAFDTNAAYEAFTEWVELYNKYTLDRSFDFFNRFRTGVMAMSIQPYSSYNQLYAAAPEIRGLWAMAPVPGTVREDGTINRAENSSSTGCIMLNAAKKKGLDEEAFEFMSWWTSSASQIRYGKALEATMGVAARFTPANKEALQNIGWNSQELNVISSQLSEVINFREMPGNYVLPRALTSAFRNALTSIELPERQLELYNKDINAEMERKAEEFDLY